MSSTDLGTFSNRPDRNNTTGTARNESPTASTIRFRSDRLAKRHMPRYNPKRQKTAVCNGTTNARETSQLWV